MKKQKVQAKINLEALAGGAFAEKLNEALMQVAENIQNPNTEATTKRQIRIRNQRKHKLQLLHRDRIRPASLWILKTEENRHLLPLPN